MKRRRAIGLLLASAIGVLGASCTGDDTSDATPPTPSGATDTTAPVDYSAVPLGSVRGTTSTTELAAVGTSAIVGTVTGPSGPVPGATVRIERLVGSTPVPIDVLTDATGRYEHRNVPGGRYRLRAFLPPALALVEPTFHFVSAGAEQVVDLVMTDQRGIRARAAVAPSTPVIDEAVNLAVVVVSRRVDDDGVVRGVPISNVRVELDGLGSWELRGRRPSGFPTPGRVATTTTTIATFSSVSFTDSTGQATFELRCRRAGSPGLSIRLSVMTTPATAPGEPPGVPVPQIQTIPLDLPDCVDPTTPVVDPNAPTTTAL